MNKRSRSQTVWALVRAVFWSFFGVRRRSDYDNDTQHLKPYQLIVCGLVGALLFIFLLRAVVQWMVEYHGAPLL